MNSVRYDGTVKEKRNPAIIRDVVTTF